MPYSKSVHTVRASAAVTGSYVAGTVFGMDRQNYLGVLIQYTNGDETSLEVKIETSVDGGITYGQQTAESASGGTVAVDLAERQFDASGNYWVIVSPLICDRVRISVKATGGTPTGTCAITAVTSTV